MSDYIIQPNGDVIVHKNSITRTMIDDAYRRGRADAIEEFIKKLDMNLKDDIEAGIIKGFDAGTAMGGALYIAEQMKGK